MKLYVYVDYDAKYTLNKKVIPERGNPYGPIKLTQDEYFAFEKCEIEFLAWQEKISNLMMENSSNEKA